MEWLYFGNGKETTPYCLYIKHGLLCVLCQVLAYSCVYSYYNQDTEKMDVMEQQSENLELHTNALQILLGG